MEDSGGVTRQRQRVVLDLAAQAGFAGITWHQVAKAANLRRLAAAGLLQVLARQGRLVRLAHQRRRAKLYVLSAYVGNRDIDPVPDDGTLLLAQAMTLLRRQITCIHRVTVRGCVSCQARDLINTYEHGHSS